MSGLFCKLCLFKTEIISGSEIYLESSRELSNIIHDLFHNRIRLSQLDLDNICGPCRDKLKSFHEYYTFVLENQQKLRSCLNETDLYPPPSLVGFVTKPKDPETVLIVKNEPNDYIETEIVANIDVKDDEVKVASISEVGDIENYETIYDEHFSLEISPELQTKTETKPVKVEVVLNEGEEIRSTDSVSKKNKSTVVSHGSKKVRSHSRTNSLTAKELQKRHEEEDEWIKRYVKLVCVHCTSEPAIEFKSFSDLNEHVRKLHKNNLLIYCCGRKFRARYTLLPHLKKDHIEGPKFECKECGEKFKTELKLSTHHKKTHLHCEFCGIDMTGRKMRDQAWSHFQQHLLSGDPTYKKLAPCVCHICGKKLKDRTRIQMHLQYVHFRSVKYMCELCGIDFTSTTAYNQHQFIKHSDGPTKIPCNICGIAVKNVKWVIDAHNRLAHDNREVNCKICGQTVRNKAALGYHMKRKHGKARHKCNYCEKAFIEKRRLREHESVHLGICLYKCEYCGAEFKSHGNIAAHKRKLHPIEYAAYKAQLEAKKYELE